MMPRRFGCKIIYYFAALLIFKNIRILRGGSTMKRSLINNGKMKRFLSILVVLMMLIPSLPVKAVETEVVEEGELVGEFPELDGDLILVDEENPPVEEELIEENNDADAEEAEEPESIEGPEIIEEPEIVEEPEVVEELEIIEDLEIIDEEIEEEEISENPDGLNGPEYISSPSIFYPKGSLGPFVQPVPMMLRSMLFAEQEGDFGNIPQGPGSISLDKKETPVEGTNGQWEIKLTVTGVDGEKTSDIVLVIDRSGSMGSNGRMAAAKEAATKFVNALLNDVNDTKTRIALVSFSNNVTVHNSASPFFTAADKQTLLNAINGLSASGGTHIQSGIRQAAALLAASMADEQNMVLLGDGAATYSYEIKNPNNYLEYWKDVSDRKYYRTTSDVPESQFKYSSTVGNGSDDHSSYEEGGSGKNNNKYRNYYRHGASAVAEAGFFKDTGGTVYTINLSASGDGPWTLENIASPGKDFTASTSDLNNIFSEVAGNISYAATNAVITDPMGEMFSIPGINASNFADIIHVSRGTVSWDEATETIKWNLGLISGASPAYMWYVVEIDPSAENGVDYPTNKHTYVDYKNINGEEAEKSFPIPEVNIVIPDKPFLKIEKTADKGRFSEVGEVITYTYVVTNSGSIPIEGIVSVNDDILGEITSGTESITLQSGESFTVTATHTVSQEDLDRGFITNKAYAEVPEVVKSPTDSVTVKAVQNPQLTIEKTADRESFSDVGEVITYSYKVTNTGNVTISEPFSLDDDKIGELAVSEELDSLAPGESFTVTAEYKVTEEDMEAGFVKNIVKVTGHFGEEEVSGEDELTIPVKKGEDPKDPEGPEEPENPQNPDNPGNPREPKDKDDPVVPISNPQVPLGGETVQETSQDVPQNTDAEIEEIEEQQVPQAAMLPDTGEFLNTRLLAIFGALLLAAGIVLNRRRRIN